MIFLDDSIGEDEVLAGEYVLGTLSASDRISVEGRLRVDPRFAARVARWEVDLSVLNTGYAEVPPPDVLKKVEARLFPVARKSRLMPVFNFLAGGVTAALLIVVMDLTFTTPRAPQEIAMLGGEGQVLTFSAVYDGRLLQVERISGSSAGVGHSYELWVIAGADAPKSLGVLDDPSYVRLYPGLAPQMTLAVSVESEGGSTTGSPTGPIVATGVIGA